METTKSLVRVGVTWIAALYVFIGSGALIAFFLLSEESTKENFQGAFQEAKDLFMLVLPIATGIITYWFAERKKASPQHPDDEGRREEK